MFAIVMRKCWASINVICYYVTAACAVTTANTQCTQLATLYNVTMKPRWTGVFSFFIIEKFLEVALQQQTEVFPQIQSSKMCDFFCLVVAPSGVSGGLWWPMSFLIVMSVDGYLLGRSIVRSADLFESIFYTDH